MAKTRTTAPYPVTNSQPKHGTISNEPWACPCMCPICFIPPLAFPLPSDCLPVFQASDANRWYLAVAFAAMAFYVTVSMVSLPLGRKPLYFNPSSVFVVMHMFIQSRNLTSQHTFGAFSFTICGGSLKVHSPYGCSGH